MRRLNAYLSRLFVTDAAILFAVLCVLLWLVNCLRSFDVVSVKGQGLLTLGYQALLTMPTLSLLFFFICIGIGLSRALQALRNSHELHIIHTINGLGSLFRAVAIVTSVGVACVLLISNFVEPYTNKRLNDLSASVAADLLSSALKPQRFTQVSPGVTVWIGSRSGSGEIQEFFADDRRDPVTRRTYIADTARVSSDGDNYIIELRNGSLQYTGETERFSEITFGRYDLSVERLTQTVGATGGLETQDSLTIIGNAISTGKWSAWTVTTLVSRLAEGTRVIGIALIVLCISGFPSGKRARFAVPMEAIVMLIAFAERGISSYSPSGPITGSIIMIAIGLGVILWRVRPRRIPEAVVA